MTSMSSSASSALGITVHLRKHNPLCHCVQSYCTDLIEVSLTDEPELVGENIGVGGDACHRASHVLVQPVDLLRVEDLFKLICVEF